MRNISGGSLLMYAVELVSMVGRELEKRLENLCRGFIWDRSDGIAHWTARHEFQGDFCVDRVCLLSPFEDSDICLDLLCNTGIRLTENKVRPFSYISNKSGPLVSPETLQRRSQTAFESFQLYVHFLSWTTSTSGVELKLAQKEIDEIQCLGGSQIA
jgi:hypothetical protein